MRPHTSVCRSTCAKALTLLRLLFFLMALEIRVCGKYVAPAYRMSDHDKATMQALTMFHFGVKPGNTHQPSAPPLRPCWRRRRQSARSLRTGGAIGSPTSFLEPLSRPELLGARRCLPLTLQRLPSRRPPVVLASRRARRRCVGHAFGGRRAQGCVHARRPPPLHGQDAEERQAIPEHHGAHKAAARFAGVHPTSRALGGLPAARHAGCEPAEFAHG